MATMGPGLPLLASCEPAGSVWWYRYLLSELYNLRISLLTGARLRSGYSTLNIKDSLFLMKTHLILASVTYAAVVSQLS